MTLSFNEHENPPGSLLKMQILRDSDSIDLTEIKESPFFKLLLLSASPSFLFFLRISVFNNLIQRLHAGASIWKTSHLRLGEREGTMNITRNIGQFLNEATCPLVVRYIWDSVIGTKLTYRSAHLQNFIFVELCSYLVHQTSLLKCYFFLFVSSSLQASSSHLIRTSHLFFEASCWFLIL